MADADTDPDPGLMTLLAEALGRADPAARATYLEGACRGDDALRRRVEGLLAAHEGAGRFPETDATDALETGATETREMSRASVPVDLPPSELATGDHRPGGDGPTIPDAPPAGNPGRFVPGQVIAGRYTLLEVLGEGGMGTVYRAEQSRPVKRQVALKLIRVGLGSRVVLARFDAERQALALMDHPNIARVFDGGATESGRPFFAMELVQGVPITEDCDRHRLPVRARLELFVQVCQAVQHAHQKGVILRDLKPSNVMVAEFDGRPTPKVIDFGVAKATEIDLTDQSLGDTGAIVGTPTYMSPEQADPSSMDIDTRTDVYALGVILYELLAGSPPLDASEFKRGAFLEMLRMVREVDPPRPSTRVGTADALPSIAAVRGIDPEHLKRALRGDLDWIVMKALEKDRARRYETATGFGADVMRHLASEPVLAAPPGRAYRMRKFVRKHRGPVIGASLVLLALMAGIAGTTWGLIRAAKANSALAVKNGELTEANGRVTRANADLGAANAKVKARYDLAVEAIKTFHTGASEDLLLQEDRFKDLRNRLLNSAAGFYEKLGTLLKDDADLSSRRALLRANKELAELSHKVGRRQDALAIQRRVSSGLEALARSPGADPSTAVDLAGSLMSIGVALSDTGQSDEALATYERARSAVLAGDGGPSEGVAARSTFAWAESRIGLQLMSIGRMAEALRAMERARDILAALFAADPTDSGLQSALALKHSNIGLALGRTGKPAEALASHEAARAIRQKLADANPAITHFQNELAYSHSNIGFLRSRAGKFDEATASYGAAMAIWRELADANPAFAPFQASLAGATCRSAMHRARQANSTRP